ncbi:GNAT family N-acetyltransferase [Bacillus sp. SG-1]|uniref:GNAT family N-acetyltransferase n=1 Tax=Bacillus sp. SG-1 TaxID=161544 RepID=UPI0001543623|nr:GNAT family protein [Bacillus sp. SG-1]EDL66322.1 ribosomal-protein-alanine acetyltransferase [Bacillus sp. SG-1]
MYEFLPMTDEAAEEIAYQWNYEGEYSFYNMTADQEDLEEFLHPDRSGYYTVEKDGKMIGYFCFQKKESGTVDIGLGMKPALTGNGLGLEFALEGMRFAIANYEPLKLSLSVASFNQRAIKVYEKAGFLPIETFMQDTNGSTYEFLKMEYEIKENEDVPNAGKF